MNQLVQQPDSLDQIRELIQSTRESCGQVIVCGAMSKIKPVELSSDSVETVISAGKFSGIVDHQASDFTITARSGTPIAELMKTLRQAGQYLPFDPVFANKGATVGGVVASGLNGPCRIRFGGLRDFVIGCQFVDDQGRTINAGGRVVKNAAGFDLPKFMIGSAGRFGLLTEITFKVFPEPRSYRTLIFETNDVEPAVRLSGKLNQLMEFDAIEITESNQVVARFCGHSDEACATQTDLLNREVPREFELLTGDQENQFWNELANFENLDDSECLVKIPLSATRIVGLDQALASQLPHPTRRISAAGNVALVVVENSTTNLSALHGKLENLELSGQVIVGRSDQYLLGKKSGFTFLQRIKKALDANSIFGKI